MMTMELITIAQAKVCNMCGSDWTTQTKLEKFCGKCNSHLIEIGGEVYSQQGW